MNKDIVIESLQQRFVTDRLELDLIEASCENIYHWGRVQGMNEALEAMERDMKLEGVA